MKYLTLAVIFLTQVILKANGGPVDEGYFYRLGIIKPINVNDVTLQKELLLINIDGDYSNVTVFYTLKNIGTEKSIQFGFPVDWDVSDRGEISDEIRLRDLAEDVNAFSIYDGSSKLLVSEKLDSNFITMPDINKYGEKYILKLKRKWFVTKINFEAGENKEVSVSYRVKNNFSDWSTSKSSFVEYTNRSFIYDFTPAANWGTGIVEEMKVIIDASEIFTNYGTCNVTGLDELQNQDGKFIFCKTDFNISQLNRLKVSYDNSVFYKSKEIIHDALKINRDFNAVTSSKLPKTDPSDSYEPDYSKKSMFDMDFSTSWVEGEKGSGIGAHIDIDFKSGYVVNTIGMVNGYSKSKDIYYKNNRIKSLLIECRYYDNDRAIRDTLYFEDLPFAEINESNFAKIYSVIRDFGDPYELTKKITLTILDVYPGSKFNDSCISELLLTGFYKDNE